MGSREDGNGVDDHKNASERRRTLPSSISEVAVDDLRTNKRCSTQLRQDEDGICKLSLTPDTDQQVHVTRPAYTVSQLRHDLCYQPRPNKTMAESLKASIKSCCDCSPGALWSLLLLRIPLLSWLPKYSFKTNLLSDVISGCTVAIMHLPQGMAYAMLAEAPPILGLYTAFFPVLAYAVFGTSRHVSVGTFAVASLMTGKIVGDLSSPMPSFASTTPALVGNLTDIEEIISTTASNLNTLSGISARSINKITLQTRSSIDVTSPSDGLLNEINDTMSEILQSTTFAPGDGAVQHGYTAVDVCVATSFMVGIWQLLFAVLHLGDMCVFLSDMLISGFTTGAAFHVLSSQIKHIFGISVPRYSGPFRLIYTYIDILKMLPTVNVTALIISAICITVLSFNNEIIKPRLKKITNFPFPIELIAVVVGTAAEYFLQYEKTNGLKTVGEIPTGLPEPRMPDYRLFDKMLVDSFVLAIIVYVVSFSMTKIFSTKHNYPVDATQELYAGGWSNIFGSFFSSIPSSASLSRSLIQESVGGKTQMVSFVSCGGILIILLFVGPLFESLPNCVLASIIIVALKGMFMQVYDCLKVWKRSKVDALLWLVSFSVTIFIDIDYGLASGVLFSLFIIFWRSYKPTVTKLGWVPNTDIYLELDSYESVVSVHGASICRVTGSLNFANIEFFKTQLAEVSGLDVAEIVAAKARLEKKNAPYAVPADDKAYLQQCPPLETATEGSRDQEENKKPDRIVVVDSSQNLTKKVIKVAILNAFKDKNSYSCGSSQTPCDTSRGHQNLAYLPDESQEQHSSSSVNGFPKQAAQMIVSQEQEVTMCVLCLAGVSWLDLTAAKHLQNLFLDYSKAGVTLVFTGVNDRAMETLRISGLFTRVPENLFFFTIHDALTTLTTAVGSKTKPRRGSSLGSTHDARPAVLPVSVTQAAVAAASPLQQSKIDLH
ncbi:SLC26A/SulP transporter [Trinorchestia longiramus]|nr:SLC26A/SulP transporter [Trinorchestia longiramus]